jgi:hypothetical protein
MLFSQRSLALALLVTSLACTATGLSGNVFRKGDVKFRVGPIPDDWELIQEDGVEGDLAAFAFRSDRRELTLGAAGRCGRDADDVPLRSLTQHLTLGFTDREILNETETQLDGRAALRTELVAKLDGVPKHFVFVVMKKDNCVYDFWRIAAGDDHDSADFDAFVGGFATVD